MHRTPPEVVSVILQIRREKNYGALRTSWYLQKHYQIYVSNVTIQRIFRKPGVPRVTARRLARLNKPPAKAHEHPGDHLQLDVKFLPKLGRDHKRYDQFTAIDACTRYRVLQIDSHNSATSAVDFIERVRQKLPCAIKELQTDHGSEFGTPFTWHVNDLGMTHRRIAPGCPEQNGKVERSHRTDEEELYRQHQFQDEQELKTRLEAWEREYHVERPHMG